MQTVLAVGFLISLAAAETTAPTGKSDTTDSASSLVTAASRGADLTLASEIPLSPSNPAERFCNHTFNYTRFSGCRDCRHGEFEPCSKGQLHVRNESCEIESERYEYGYEYNYGPAAGCRAVCLEAVVTRKCCHGYYGEDCSMECPGGSQNPCNGHGECHDYFNSCLCFVGFDGRACEMCTNKKKYGPNCTKDCVCTHGNCNSGIYGDGQCSPDNPCNNTVSPCGTNSECVHTGPGTHRCVCDQNYIKSGTQCVLENPCQGNNSGCDQTQDCIYMAPTQRKCRCKAGYEEFNNGNVCRLKDMCTPGICGSLATCETREPLKHSCICHSAGSTWDGEACSNNIIEMFQKMAADEHSGQMYMNTIMSNASRMYNTFLARYGYFTMFAPSDQAFRKHLSDAEFGKLLSDDIKLERIVRQHIIFTKHQMRNLTHLHYNLQGNPAKRDFDYYTVSYDSGYTEKSVLKERIEASNGIIYTMDDVFGLKDDQFDDHKGTVMDLIKSQPEYSRMYAMIRAANLSEKFSQPNTTVLITNNTAWGKLSLQEQNYLTSDKEGLIKLAVILKNHIFPGVIGITDLIIAQNHLKSYANINVAVKISPHGQVELDDAGITKADIPISDGLCHRVNKVMIPSYLKPFINNTCIIQETELVKGSCMPCNQGLCPLWTDTPTGQSEECDDYRWHMWHYYFGHHNHHSYDHRYHPYWENRYDDFEERCLQICQRHTQKSVCCQGFYGQGCIACPGGSKNPCNGNGKCSDGPSGTGMCTCNKNFIGTSCNQCAKNDTFGPQCDKTCTCQFGLCDTGPKGAGTCKPDTCQLGYTGENCDKKLVPCESDDVCKLNSQCFLAEDGSNRCFCAPGYENDGNDCLKLDLCADERSPCHHQATCSQKGPDIINCTCNNGWHGDGFQCMPNHPCDGSTKCHRAAICLDVEPGQYVCVCKTGYKGNGLVCDLVDLCIENNGGCHPKAECTFIQEGERNCTCPDLMSGDGITCRGTIFEEVMKHPKLTTLRDLMKLVNPSNRILDTMNSTYTFFAPGDDVLQFFLKIRTAESGYWQQEENVLSFLNFHTIYDAFSTGDMMAFDGVIKSYPTLFDGFSLRIVNTNKSLHIFADQSKFAMIEEANIPAFNGYFHIINRILEPFLPDKNPPSLSEFLSSKPEYKMFYAALQKTKLLDVVSSLNEYTLFVLQNSAFKKIARKPTANFLKYYIVPKLIFTPCIIDGDEVDTLLGSQYRLLFTYHDGMTMVNNERLTRPDMITAGGVIHEVEYALHPVFNRCDLNSSMIDLGPCGDCVSGNLTCPFGYTSLGASHVIKYKCHFQKFEGWDTTGCRQICVKYTSKSGCCAGFYGFHCDECPGGAESSCSGNGVCDDGIERSGRCKCNMGFGGTVCERCDSTDLVPPYCNISYNSCGYMNGNCSEHARCNETTGGVTCQCSLGYQGDGHTCTRVCDSVDQRGCHPQARSLIHRKHVVPGLVAVVIILLVALVAIIIYKKRDRLFRQRPTNPHCDIAFSKIKMNECEDTVSMPDDTQYANPLYNSQNLQ
ncbi:hypothetical protein BsWGS_13708 [Bradybaena similaris]